MMNHPAVGGLAYWMNRLASLDIHPNFYCSLAYLTASGAQCYLTPDGDWAYVVDADDGDPVCMFPPVPANDRVAAEVPRDQWPALFGFIWSGFNGYPAPEGYETELLDYQYIYDQRSVAAAEGAAYATHRKNARKWPNRTGHRLEAIAAVRLAQPVIQELCGVWLEERGGDVEDVPNMLRYLLTPPPGGIVRALVDPYGYPRAIIAYDMNHRYINFRYCITRPGEPFLEDYVRSLFYASPAVQAQAGTRLVNDGGMVDSPGLAQFKERLCPVERLSCESWICVR